MSPSLHQTHLEDVVKRIFKGTNIITNSRSGSRVVNPSTSSFFELDVWLPSLLLSFEFQDVYHYETTWYSQAPLSDIQEKDSVKGLEASRQGMTLIRVPYWWDANINSLIATVLFHRPDLSLFLDTTTIDNNTDNINNNDNNIDNININPIPLNPISLNSEYDIPVVGEVMLASFAVSPSQFSLSLSPHNSWWMGEKYDGIRFVWNNNFRQFYSRRGQVLRLLKRDYGLSHPSPFFDGEIWGGRGMFNDVQKIISSDVVPWDSIRGVVFDDATPGQFADAFETRYERVLCHLSSHHSFLIVAVRMMCSQGREMMRVMRALMADSGEGLILRQPGSPYQPGRSTYLVKVKSSRVDAEALVIGVNTEAVTLKLPNGNTFEVEWKEVDENLKLKEGDIVTFEFDQYSRREIPVNPFLSRVRCDVGWKDILSDHLNSSPQNNLITRVSDGISEFTSKPQGYWSSQDGKNLRKLFEDFAKQRNLDPLDAQTWYSMGRYMLEDEKGAHTAFTIKGGYVKALKSIFPELELDESKFAFLNQGYWRNIANRKQFFTSFAKDNNFDPLVPENWYKISRQDLVSRKGHKSVLEHYNGNVGKALVHLFPDVGFEFRKFGVPHGHWGDAKNRKRFFDNYAISNNFDPLIPIYWYKITREELVKSKNAIAVLKYHGDSFANALIDTYPDIGLNRNKFANPPRGLWTDKQNRKTFFDTFARENQFDSLVAANWYRVSPQMFKSRKGSAAVLMYYKGDFIAALLDLYPDIQLTKSKFPILPNRDWANVENRKAFFIAFAQDHGFDPLVAANWNSIHAAKLKSRKYADSVLQYYKGDYKVALCNLFPNMG